MLGITMYGGLCGSGAVAHQTAVRAPPADTPHPQPARTTRHVGTTVHTDETHTLTEPLHTAPKAYRVIRVYGVRYSSEGSVRFRGVR